jgi:hypothetical protein
VSQGSGFFVSSNTIVTNYHVIRGATRIYAKRIGSETLLPVERVVSEDPKRDLALLAVRGVDAPALRLGAYSSLTIGQDIFVIGNPEGLEGTLSTGIISGFRQSAGNRYIQITAPISHGSSGGPVLNASGEVIGVAVAFKSQGQNLNFAIPVDDVKALLSPTNAGVGHLDPVPETVAPKKTGPAPNLMFAERVKHYLQLSRASVDEYKSTADMIVSNYPDPQGSKTTIVIVNDLRRNLYGFYIYTFGSLKSARNREVVYKYLLAANDEITLGGFFVDTDEDIGYKYLISAGDLTATSFNAAYLTMAAVARERKPEIRQMLGLATNKDE